MSDFRVHIQVIIIWYLSFSSDFKGKKHVKGQRCVGPRDEQTQMLVGRTGCRVKTGAQEVPSVLAKFSPARGLAPFLLVQGWDQLVTEQRERGCWAQ